MNHSTEPVPQDIASTLPLHRGQPIDMPEELERAVRWRSFFAFNALQHRHTERPAYL